VGLGALAVLVVFLVGAEGRDGAEGLGPPASGLRVSVLDVGQGDAILLQPAGAAALLVDAGPVGGGIASKLWTAGVERLGAAIVSHDQADHAGGLAELFGEVPVETLLYAIAERPTLAAARVAGATTRRVAAGDELRSGGLRLEVLWPPPELASEPSRSLDDPNRLSLVLLLRWRHFSMLLTGDAEAEAIPLDPGPVDVLKVAHHGSEDAGLDGLLDRTMPRVAVLSVGSDNPFGHPTLATLSTLAEHGVRSFRTDRDGTLVFDVGRDSFQARALDRTGLNESPNRFSGFRRRRLRLSAGGPMAVSVTRKRPQLRPRRLSLPSLLGDGMPERLRSTSIGLLGVVAALGLGTVALALQLGLPPVASGPLPEPPSKRQAVAERAPLKEGAPAETTSEPLEPKAAGSAPSGGADGESPTRVESTPVAPVARAPGEGAVLVTGASPPPSEPQRQPPPRRSPQRPSAVPSPAVETAPVAPPPVEPSASASEVPSPPPEGEPPAPSHPGNGNAYGKGNGNGNGNGKGNDGEPPGQAAKGATPGEAGE
jgi:beta-lactamase superfamily II metal-dependent hydrolase